MLRFGIALFFVALTFLSWGVYGPVLHMGQEAMQRSSLRPFLCVGVAYFLVAVVVPLALLRSGSDAGRWTVGGTIWSLAAGAAGALGALGIILAFKSRGRPLDVMPLVFGGAPVINTLVTMWMTRTYKQAGPLFIAGILLVALGAAGVMRFKPSPAHLPPAGSQLVESHAALQQQGEVKLKQPLLARELFGIIGAVTLTACCWGCYGPILHKGQTAMEGSRLRPFLCVGLAYFAIAVVIPLAMLLALEESGQWTLSGTLLSLLAGTAGAVGALGVIMAFTFGGRPIYVMPLVFGGAPIINTMFTMLQSSMGGNTLGELSVWFYLSLILVILGAVTVLVFAPRPAYEKNH